MDIGQFQHESFSTIWPQRSYWYGLSFASSLIIPTD